MLHTRFRCKQQKKRVVNDEIGLTGQEEGKRREEKQRSGAGRCCDGVQRDGVDRGYEVKEEGEGMCEDGEGGGEAQPMELRHVAL
jgi:hypothetical protein